MTRAINSSTGHCCPSDVPGIMGVAALGVSHGVPEIAQLMVWSVHVRQPQLPLGVASSHKTNCKKVGSMR